MGLRFIIIDTQGMMSITKDEAQRLLKDKGFRMTAPHLAVLYSASRSTEPAGRRAVCSE